MTFLDRFSIEHYVDCHKYDSVLQPWERKAVENGKVSLAEVGEDIERRVAWQRLQSQMEENLVTV